MMVSSGLDLLAAGAKKCLAPMPALLHDMAVKSNAARALGSPAALLEVGRGLKVREFLYYGHSIEFLDNQYVFLHHDPL
jgi:hypothetical protein